MNLYGLTPESFSRLILSIGSHKGGRPFSPIEVAESFRTMIRNGATAEECARAVHLDGTAMISRFLRLNHLDEQVKHLVDWGGAASIIGFTCAQELSRIPENEHREVATKILEHRLSSSEVKQIAQLVIRSGRSGAECADEVIGMRPQVEIRHVVVGSVVSQEAEERLAELTQSERNQIIHRAINAALNDKIDISASLSPKRFTMSGDRRFSDAFRFIKGDFETIITNHILTILYE